MTTSTTTSHSELSLKELAVLPELIPSIQVGVITQGLAGLFNRDKLYAVAIMGSPHLREDVAVPVVHWTNARVFAEKVPCKVACFVATGDHRLMMKTWPPQTMMNYAAWRDEVYGAIVRVPKVDFEEVKRKT